MQICLLKLWSLAVWRLSIFHKYYIINYNIILLLNIMANDKRENTRCL